MDRYDVAIIGSGPAGLEAAVNLKIRNKRFILFGSDNLSRKIVAAPRVDNYLGLYGVTGQELQQRFMDHLRSMEIAITAEQVQMIYPMDDFFALTTSRENFEATAVILAPGAAPVKHFPGEEALLGRGVGYCATCDGPLYRGKRVAILGYTDEAVHEAEYMGELAETVYYVPMAKTSRLPNAPVQIAQDTVESIEGEQTVGALRLKGRTLEVDGVFILRESVAPAALLPGLAMDGLFIHVNQHMETNLAGCFAAGDCTGMPHQYMRAAGQGQTAALRAVTHLNELKVKKGAL